MAGVVETPQAQATLERHKVADGRVIRAGESKRFRLGGLRENTTDNTGMHNYYNHLVRMSFDDTVESPGNPSIQLGVAFRAGDFPPLLVLVHFSNLGVILMRFDSEDATLPIAQVDFSQILNHSGRNTLDFTQLGHCFVSAA